MTWNYRIIHHDNDRWTYYETYALHEVFYDEQGIIKSWTSDPVAFAYETAEEIIRALQQAVVDVERLPTLVESELPVRE